MLDPLKHKIQESVESGNGFYPKKSAEEFVVSEFEVVTHVLSFNVILQAHQGDIEDRITAHASTCYICDVLEVVT